MKPLLKSALREDVNILSLATAAALSLALLSPVPVLVAFVAEAAYLMYVPDAAWYAVRVRRCQDAARLARRARSQRDIFPQLYEASREQYLRLEAQRVMLGVQAQAEDDKDAFVLMSRLDDLLDLLLQVSAKASSLPLERIMAGDKMVAEAELPEQGLFQHFEREAEALREMAQRETRVEHRQVLNKGVVSLEREGDQIALQGYHAYTAQFLLDSAESLIGDAERLLTRITVAMEGDDRAGRDAARADTEDLIASARSISERLSKWLEAEKEQATQSA